MDFEPDFIAEDTYWAFGLFADKNENIDYKKLKKDLEQIEYYIAAIDLKTADGDYFGRLCQSCGYRWILENMDDPDDDCSEIFKDFTGGSVFQKFAEQAYVIIQRGFAALENTLETNPEEFKKNGINISKIKNLISMSASIMKKVSIAFEHPIQKI